jgi:hypothetical protein
MRFFIITILKLFAFKLQLVHDKHKHEMEKMYLISVDMMVELHHDALLMIEEQSSFEKAVVLL